MTKKPNDRAVRHLQQAETRRLDMSKKIAEAEIVLAWACVMNDWPSLWQAREERLLASKHRFSRLSAFAYAAAGF